MSMGFGEIDDMFSRVDRMMNSMMNSMLGGGIGFMDPFEMMNPMNSMNQMALQSAMASHRSHPMSTALQPLYQPFCNPHVYSSGISSYSSSIVTMTSDGRGRPQVYEASSSTRVAPGGVRETKSTIRDSRTGRHEMSIGHHIQDKSHVVKKSKNYYTGQEDHEEDFVNVEEDEEANFENEWRRRANAGYRAPNNHGMYRPNSGLTISELPPEEPRLALPAPPATSHSPTPTSSSRLNRHSRDPHRSLPQPTIVGHRSNDHLVSPTPYHPEHRLSPMSQSRRDQRRERSRRDKPYDK